MAGPIHSIETFGNDLVIRLIDGQTVMCLSTGGGLWYPMDHDTSGPGPGDPDPESPGFAWPFPLSCVSSEYGPRSGRIHQGIDFSNGGTGEAFPNAPILASYGGTVSNNPHVYHSGFGWHVILNHGVIGGRQLYTLYAHMPEGSTRPTTGTVVAKGDQIGNVGNSGNSFGAHLHWETHAANPGGGPTWSNPGTHMNPRDFMAIYGEGA